MNYEKYINKVSKKVINNLAIFDNKISNNEIWSEVYNIVGHTNDQMVMVDTRDMVEDILEENNIKIEV